MLASRDPLPIEAERWRVRLDREETTAYLGRGTVVEVRRFLAQGRLPDPPARGHILPNTDLFPRDEFARHWRDQ